LVGFGVGSFVGVLLALLAIALARPADSDPIETVVVTATPASTSPAGGPTAAPTPAVRTRTALEVHIGPGNAFAIIGTVPRNDLVSVIGRNDDGKWVAIRFPPNSTARGWVEAESLQGIEENRVSALPVLVATPLAISVSTPIPGSGGGGTGGGGGGATNGGGGGSGASPPAVTATPGPNVGPTDLVINRLTVLPDGRVSVQIGNRGPGDIVGRQILVQVRDLASAAETLIFSGSIASGDTVTITSTNFRVSSVGDVLAIVDFGNSHNDPNRGNNSMTQTLAPVPTATPVLTPEAQPFRAPN